MWDISLETKNLYKLLNATLSVDKAIQPALRRFGHYQLNSIKSNFIRQRDPDGNAWKPLKPATIKRKGHSLILRDSYKMFRGTEMVLQRNRIIIRNKLPYTKYHQTGTSKMAQRKFLGFSKRNVEELKKYVSQEVLKRL